MARKVTSVFPVFLSGMFLFVVVCLMLVICLDAAGAEAGRGAANEPRRTVRLPAADRGNAKRHAVPKEHPRLLGSRDRLRRLSRQRADAYGRVARVARQQKAGAHSKLVSMALVCAVEQDREPGRQAIEMAMETIDGPIQKGHTPFAHDLARCAILVHDPSERWPNIRAGRVTGNDGG